MISLIFVYYLRLIKAFQFVEKHGEVCPANWTPDSPTIKPDPKEIARILFNLKNNNLLMHTPIKLVKYLYKTTFTYDCQENVTELKLLK